ncbi:MAG: insulinase family protein [Acidobacteria bacterium]|nr:insulinase family protein [Acidobacteriota bacterium]MBU4307629.1 insulinase family protein [Acidobacteriota bacterium]MCG2810433.1 insulinase family protein [Candidatus Aminicenantes bacterium]
MRKFSFSMAWLLLWLALTAGIAAQEIPWKLGHEPGAYALANGLSVILQKDDAAAITSVQLLMRGGDRDDPPGLSGLAYLTARLSLEIPDQSKLQQLMDFGSSFSLAVGGDYTLLTVRSLSRHLDATLAIISAILVQPLFSDMRIAAVKELMLHLQKREMDDPTSLMRLTLARTFFANSAYGAARFGNETSLAEIGKKDIQAFFRSHYVAGNMTAVVISDLDADIIKPILARHLGVIPAGPRLPFTPVGLRQLQGQRLTLERQAAQAHVSLSVLLPEATADHFLMAALLETWLGKGIGSRLWSLRSRGDLAYGLNAELKPNREAMLLSVYLQTDNRRSPQALTELMQLIQTVHDTGSSEAELAAAKAYARADFWRENETREHRAATLAFLEGSGLSYHLAGDFSERLEKISLEEFNRALRAWLAPERWFILLIGQAAE